MSNPAMSQTAETIKSDGEQVAQDVKPPELTAEENAELTARPITQEFRSFTREQIELRRSIGRKWNEFFMRVDTTMSESIRKCYAEYPPWQFYQVRGGTQMKRIYGICEYQDGTFGAHTVTCMMMFTNDTVGGTPLRDLEPILELSDAQLASACFNNAPGVFCDPLGYMLPLVEESRRRG
jgi:hypothetical protein